VQRWFGDILVDRVQTTIARRSSAPESRRHRRSRRVVHFEIPYDDDERARSLYTTALGWDCTEMPGMGYTLITGGPRGEEGPTEPGFVNWA